MKYFAFFILLTFIHSCSVFDGNEAEEKDPCIFCGGSFFATDSEPAWSPDGKTIAYVGADSVGELGIYLINPDGKNKRLLHSGNVGSPSWSPDNNWLVFHQNAQIFKKHIQTDSLVQLTFEGRNFFPDWSPDGEWIAYDNTSCGSSNEPLPENGCGILIINKNGSNKNLLVRGRMPDWSFDNESLVYVGLENEIYKFNLSSESEMRLTISNNSGSNSASNYYPKYSPDGTKLLFTSQPYASQMNIYLMDLNDESMKQLTQEGGYTNDWSPDGAWIVYTETSETGRLWLMKPDGSEKKQLTYED